MTKTTIDPKPLETHILNSKNDTERRVLSAVVRDLEGGRNFRTKTIAREAGVAESTARRYLLPLQDPKLDLVRESRTRGWWKVTTAEERAERAAHIAGHAEQKAQFERLAKRLLDEHGIEVDARFAHRGEIVLTLDGVEKLLGEPKDETLASHPEWW